MIKATKMQQTISDGVKLFLEKKVMLTKQHRGIT